MKLLSKTLVCATLILAIFAVSCAKPPTEEMNNAAEAVTRAQNDNDADTYARSLVLRARDALTRMHAAAAEKRYDAAKSAAADAINLAERAINEGREGALRTREEAAALISQLRPVFAETKQRLTAAQDADLPLDFPALDRDYDNALFNYNEAQSALSTRQYQESLSLGQTTRGILNTLNQQLSTVTMTVTRRK